MWLWIHYSFLNSSSNELLVYQVSFCFCMVWGFTLRSTAMVMLRWSVHLPTLFPGKAGLSGNQYFLFILSFLTRSNPSWIRARRRMIAEIISWSIFTKVCNWCGIEPTTPGSALQGPVIIIFRLYTYRYSNRFT